MSDKPWDARLAAWLVAPLVDSRVHPNVLTTVRLVVGLTGAVLFAAGSAFNLAALLIVCSNFLDHTDGQLARLSGKTSRFGHYYDLVCDALVTVGIFVGLGFGLQASLGWRSIAYGVIAGLAIGGIFHLRHLIDTRHGKAAARQPTWVGFEAEDVLYLLPLVTLTDQQAAFFTAAAVGAPIAFLIVLGQFLKLPDAKPKAGSSGAESRPK
jgi:phosphatidylglycerophosphate synthase